MGKRFVNGADKLDHMMVRESDFHQLILWIAFLLQQYSRRPALSQLGDFAKACEESLTYLEGDGREENAIKFVLEHCLSDGVWAASNKGNRARPISRQQGATRRLAQTIGLALLLQTRTAVRGELSLMYFASQESQPIFSPEHETQLAGKGISVKVAQCPIRGDVVFEGKAFREMVQRFSMQSRWWDCRRLPRTGLCF
jgi:hypothetical protein